MQYLERALDPTIMGQIVGVSSRSHSLAEFADYVCCVLFNVQLQPTTGLAYTMTKTPTDEYNFDTSRPLLDQCGRTKRQTMASTLIKIVVQNLDADRFIEPQTTWEFDIPDYETAKALLRTRRRAERCTAACHADRRCPDQTTELIVVNYCKKSYRFQCDRPRARIANASRRTALKKRGLKIRLRTNLCLRQVS